MAKADQKGGMLTQQVGPYEAWVFGAGKEYSGGGSNPGKFALTAALGELPPKHDLLKARKKVVVKAGPKQSKLGFAYTPTLWEAGFIDYDVSKSYFSPLVIETRKGFRESGLREIEELLSAVLKANVLGGPKPQYGFRLNNPLRSTNFDPEFYKHPAKPQPKPDPVLLKRLQALPPPGPGHDAAPLAIVAVIDDMLPFAHRNTLASDGSLRSRMEFCWLQSADIAKDRGDRTVLFGREHTRHSIEALLRKHNADEDELYRAASTRSSQYPDAFSEMGLWSHGAAVLDIAAGHRHPMEMPDRPSVKPDGDMDRVRLIGVELPVPAVMDTVGFGKDCYILSAFHYILDRTDKIEKAYGVRNIPLIINFSFGFTGGPHDGSDRLEQAIQGLIRARNKLGKPTKLVMPSGNSFQASLYGEIHRNNLDAEDCFTIPWRVQPNDQTSSYLEIWYPKDENSGSGPQPIRPSIEGPNGEELCLVPLAEPQIKPPDPSQNIWNVQISGNTIGQLSLDRFRGQLWRAMFILAPTDVGNCSKFPVAPAGLWRIRVAAPQLKTMSGFVSCRIQRDANPLPSFRNGRQSYFDHTPDQLTRYNADGTLRWDDHVAQFMRRFGTLNGLSTHDEVFVVGGFVKSSQEASDYSSAGRTSLAPGGAGVVTCSAPSDDSYAVSGQASIGIRSGSYTRLVGTSGAAPHVARGIVIGYLEPNTPRIIRNTPIKGLTAKPAPHDPNDQTKISSLRLGIGMMTS